MKWQRMNKTDRWVVIWAAINISWWSLVIVLNSVFGEEILSSVSLWKQITMGVFILIMGWVFIVLGIHQYEEIKEDDVQHD